MTGHRSVCFDIYMPFYRHSDDSHILIDIWRDENARKKDAKEHARTWWHVTQQKQNLGSLTMSNSYQERQCNALTKV